MPYLHDDRIANRIEAEIEEIENEIAELREWIEENPGKFDGVAEKERDIRYLRVLLKDTWDELRGYE